MGNEDYMKTYRMEISEKFPPDYSGILTGAHSDYDLNISQIARRRVYLFESSVELTQGWLCEIGEEIFCDPISQTLHLSNRESEYEIHASLGYRPGVTDNTAKTAMEALNLLGQSHIKVSSGELWSFKGKHLDAEKLKLFAHEFLGNDLLQEIKVYASSDIEYLDRFQSPSFPHVSLHGEGKVEEIQLFCSDNELVEMSKRHTWALTLDELKTIQRYYQDETVQAERKQMGLSRLPTDGEIEVLAQTWSEHCKHKIFSANITYEEGKSLKGKKLGSKEIKGLFPTFIKGVSQAIIEKRNIDWCKSLFKDNAGVIRFDSKLDYCFKVETHNSPSALDPYGGSLTGILGVNRDILGCGLGAKPVANTDVFCLGPPKLSSEILKQRLPKGLKNPARILEGVHLGVEDGGNKSGIPTVNGSFQFDSSYSGKPLVFVGTLGFMPQKLPDGRDGFDKEVKPGDRVFVVGGGVGADGIHGATFSSLELDDTAPATAVQIGDPITQKRVLDFTLEARDKGYYRAITDNGAGGLSSSIGEMATLCNGARIDLKNCPLKYPGLKPYEILISESQERMTYAVPVEKEKEFLELAKLRGVVASDLGEFTDDGKFSVFYGDTLVAYLDLEFMHEGLPPMELFASTEGEDDPRRSPFLFCHEKSKPGEIEEILKRLLASPNITSKEKLVRRYDHEVQAATLVKPYGGKAGHTPSDAGVLWLFPHGGDADRAVAVSHGLAPKISSYDCYTMAQYSVDEAFRSLVATGANPEKVALLDNFCWPDPVKATHNPDGQKKLADLVRSCQGLYDICLEYGAPLISGKDSMKNDFVGKMPSGEDVKISVPPTLLVSAVGSIDSVENILTTEFQDAGDMIALVGPQEGCLANSEFSVHYETSDSNPKDIDISKQMLIYKKFYTATTKNIWKSSHDISDGGLMVSLYESLGQSGLGAEIVALKDLSLSDFYRRCFSESPGRILVSFDPINLPVLKEIFSSDEFSLLGNVHSKPEMRISRQEDIILPLNSLHSSYQEGIQ